MGVSAIGRIVHYGVSSRLDGLFKCYVKHTITVRQRLRRKNVVLSTALLFCVFYFQNGAKSHNFERFNTDFNLNLHLSGAVVAYSLFHVVIAGYKMKPYSSMS